MSLLWQSLRYIFLYQEPFEDMPGGTGLLLHQRMITSDFSDPGEQFFLQNFHPHPPQLPVHRPHLLQPADEGGVP